MKIFTEIERREIEGEINAVIGWACIERPAPELFLDTLGDNPAFITSEPVAEQWKQFDDEHMAQYAHEGAQIQTDRLACACRFQPFVDWAVFATREGRFHLMHRFRLN